VSAAPITPAQLTARLAVEFCVPAITGSIKGVAPVEGRLLTADERVSLGLTVAGATMVYPIGDDAVLLDMAEASSTLWFNRADCVEAPALVDAALRAAFPAIDVIADIPNPQDPTMRARGYKVELGSGRVCNMDMGYPMAEAQGESRMFVLRVNALIRQ